MQRFILTRLPLLALAALSLLTGMWIGLVRMGWTIPPLAPAAHGPLMIGGFLGTMIGLERAVAARRRWAYAAPVLSAVGGVALWAGAPGALSQVLLTGSSAVLLAALAVTYLRHYGLKVEWPGVTMGIGALAWLVGNGLWLAGWAIPQVTPWWIGFLIITIAGERLELARTLFLRRTARVAFLISLGVFLAGLALSSFAFSLGLQISGAGLIVLGGWLLYFDVARRTIRKRGLTRFIAACLLPGYVWLMVAGAFWLMWPDYFAAGPYYDAMLHTILLGFVFSMIFGHEPIIVPALLGTAITYRPIFYGHLVLLHASLIMRVVGDLASWPDLRMWAGLLNVTAILVFMANTIASTHKPVEVTAAILDSQKL